MQRGDTAIADFYVVNEKNLKGKYRLSVTCSDNKGVFFEKTYAVKLEGGNTYGQLLVKEVKITPREEGYTVVRAFLCEGNEVKAEGMDKLYAVGLHEMDSSLDVVLLDDSLGHIAKRVVELLAPFHCTILVCNRTHNEEEALKYGITYASKERILEEADIISIHLPLTPESKNLFSTSEFKAMKKNAFIINTARGGIIDEEALKIALKTGEIAGAGLEAFLEEPTHDWELIDLPNLVCTPHLGGNSKESILAMGYSCIEHLKTFCAKK
jgi:hypothetical protein